MRMFKPLTLGVSTRAHPYDGAGLFVITTYSLFDLLDPTDILNEMALWPLAAQEMPPGAILDEGMPKPAGEVLLAGKAMAPGGVPVQEMAVGVEIGPVRRAFTIFGDREWIGDPAGAVMGPASQFLEMPLVAERAFGGQGFPANPVGMGFHTESLLSTGMRAPLPNIEERGREVLGPADQPRPALFGPFGPDTPARIALAGTYDQHWIDHRMPEFPDDFQLKYFMTAPAEHRLPGYFAGNEAIRLVGMSADRPEVISRLPGVRVRVFVKRESDQSGLREIKTQTDTVWLFGSQLKGLVINRGVIAIADRDGLDVSDVMAAYEWAAEPERPLDHYQNVFQLRTDPEDGFKYMLADSQLSPVIAPEVLQAREERRRIEAERQAERTRERLRWHQERQLAQAGVPKELIPDIAPSGTKPFLMPTDEDIALADIDVARLISDTEDLIREADAKMAALSETGDTMVAGLKAGGGADTARPQVDDAASEAAATGFLPAVDAMLPSKDLNAALSRLESGFESARSQAEDLDPEPRAAFERILDQPGSPAPEDEDVAFEQARGRIFWLPEGSPFAEAHKQIGDMRDRDLSLETLAGDDAIEPSGPQGNADLDALLADIASEDTEKLEATIARTMPALKPEPGQSRLAAMQDVLQRIETPPAASPSEQLAQGREKLDDAEAQFKEATDAARLASPAPVFPLQPLTPGVAGRLGEYVRHLLDENRSLAGADLAGADLTGVDFSGRDLTKTKFESCALVGARFKGADCSDAVFTGANLTGADFDDARLTGANLSRTQSRHALFRGADLSDTRIIEADFATTDLSNADLSRAQLIGTDVSGARIVQSILANVTGAELKGSGLVADGAYLSDVAVVRGAFDGSSWKGARLERVAFAEAGFAQSDFSGARLEDVAFAGNVGFADSLFIETVAVNSGFHGVDLSRASFRRARFQTCNFMQATVSDVDLRLASIKGSNFNYTIMHRANAFGGTFVGTGFRAADLQASSFRDANLYQGDLSEARLAGVDFTGANVRLTNMEATAK